MGDAEAISQMLGVPIDVHRRIVDGLRAESARLREENERSRALLLRAEEELSGCNGPLYGKCCAPGYTEQPVPEAEWCTWCHIHNLNTIRAAREEKRDG